MIKAPRDNRVIANGPSQNMVKDPQVLSNILKGNHALKPNRVENDRSSLTRSKQGIKISVDNTFEKMDINQVMKEMSIISPDHNLDLHENLSGSDIPLSRGPSIERDKVIDDFSTVPRE
jgi:hypothetical protein